MRLLLQGLLGATAALTLAAPGPDGSRHHALLQRQGPGSFAYETKTVLHVDLIPALSTLTVYQTTDITVTGCPSSVLSCPDVSTTVFTATTAVYTTLCPVTLTSSRVGPFTSRRNSPARTSGAIPLSNCSLPSAANSSLETATGASGIPSFLDVSSNWPATIYSTHLFTTLVGDFPGDVRTETETMTLIELSTSFGELTTTVPGSTCYCSTTMPTKSVSLHVPLPVAIPNVTGILPALTGSSTLNISFTPLETIPYTSSGPYGSSLYNSTAPVTSFDPYNPTASSSTADPNDPNGVSFSGPYESTASAPGVNPFDPTMVAPGVVNATTSGVYSTAAFSDTAVANDSSANSSAVAPTSPNTTTYVFVAITSGNSQGIVVASTTLVSATFNGNISSIALRSNAQAAFSGAESENMSALVFGLIALVYLAMFIRL